AMLLDRLLGARPGWRITVLAGDVDAAALERAQAGVYGDWSLRATPTWARERYFRPHPDGHELDPELRERVTFATHNLHTDAYPGEIDLLVCRNVLMYFTPQARASALTRPRDALAPRGWLLLGPAEASPAAVAPLRQTQVGEAIFYREP